MSFISRLIRRTLRKAATRKADEAVEKKMEKSGEEEKAPTGTEEYKTQEVETKAEEKE